MMVDPQLSDDELRLLRIIYNERMISGSQLMRSAGVWLPNELMQRIQKLTKLQLIEVSGATSDPTSLTTAMFGIRPSAREFLRDLIGRHSAA